MRIIERPKSIFTTKIEFSTIKILISAFRQIQPTKMQMVWSLAHSARLRGILIAHFLRCRNFSYCDVIHKESAKSKITDVTVQNPKKEMLQWQKLFDMRKNLQKFRRDGYHKISIFNIKRKAPAKRRDVSVVDTI